MTVSNTSAIASGEKEGVVVVGAGGLLGSAISRKLANLEVPIVLVDVDESRLQSLGTEIRSIARSEVSYLRIDKLAHDPGFEIIKFLRNIGTPSPHLVNAAYPGKDLLLRLADEQAPHSSGAAFFSAHVGFFLSVSAHFCRYAAGLGGGSLTNLSSMYARTPPKFEIYEGTGLSLPIEYGAAKAGIENFSRYLATFYLKDMVRVNCVAPGGIMASQPDVFVENYGHRTSSESLLDSNDVVDVISLLASPAGKAITGQTITVDGGFGLV